MQIHRLFEMVYILMDRKKVTARELAERFEVSTRTIYRDLDVLSGAGIPVYATKGRDGGIAMLESYVLDRSTLSESEQGQILMALQTMAATGAAQMLGESRNVLSKLSSLFNKGQESYIEADFSRWSGADEDREKFHKIHQALINKYVLTFGYHNSAGKSSPRRAKPIKLVFKYSTWYLQAFCENQQDYRNFKLTRMTELVVTAESFFGEQFSPPPMQMQAAEHEPVEIELIYAKEAAYLAYDEFPAALVEALPNGALKVCTSVALDDWFVPYLLSFGSLLEVIKPDTLRQSVAQEVKKMHNKYYQP